MPDRLRYQPLDALPRPLEDADALLRGRFRFAGQTVDVQQKSVFDCASPSRAWALALHSFDWLGALAGAGGDAARNLATELVTQWLQRFARYSEPAWLPEVMARRLLMILAHGRLVLANSEILWRSKLFVSLRQQTAQLGRTVKEAPEGVERLESAAVHVLARAGLDDGPRRIELALAMLEKEITKQILPDGGHISRSPEVLLFAYRQIVMVSDALTAAGVAVPAWLRSAHDRAAPMLRFFRHADGGLAVFNGGGEASPRMIEALLARDEVRGQPFQHAPHSGYQRIAAARSLVIVDCGTPPPPAYSTSAHAGCLAFEFGANGQRLVVNCGAENAYDSRWDGALRTTAAHSTATLADTSMLPVLSPGLARDLLGPRLINCSSRVATERHETAHGWRVDASHSYYLQEFGVVHERSLTLSPKGTRLTGLDRLLRQHRRKASAVPFAIRFHIHPDVRVSPAMSGDILLKLPDGDGWRFRHSGSLAMEESIYAGHGGVRRAEQLVLTGQVADEPIESAWVFERIGME